MLISVHLPKTAGSSFLAGIREHYGEALFEDYGDRPINKSALARNSHALAAAAWHGVAMDRFSGIECIHGHFMPLKYFLLRPAKSHRFVTWLRDPVERMASHYHYWMRHYNPADAGELHHRVVRENWSLERFCLGPELQNTYSMFLWGFPLRRFAFVGITEHYAEDLAYFSTHVLGRPMQGRQDNVNPDRVADGAMESDSQPASYFQDAGLREQVTRHHAQDVALYQRMLQLRQQRESAIPLADQERE